ncbi:MAG TPA: hypothetical protein VFA79_15705 [Myxococcales bacterium]|nr:hypothetical protein [Myxococcales bacterium]
MTPLLRWGDALLKLELLRPRGSVSDRAPVPSGPVALSGNQALSFARPGAEFALRGVVTHEMRQALAIWGARIVPSAPRWQPDPAVFAASLGQELLEQLAQAPALIVCPAGEAEALAGAAAALQKRWPRVRAVALLAGDVELPDLPRTAELPPGIERVVVSRAAAAQARAQVGRELGLLANHAGAAAAAHARQHGGVAIVTALGEREFSLEEAQ